MSHNINKLLIFFVIKMQISIILYLWYHNHLTVQIPEIITHSTVLTKLCLSEAMPADQKPDTAQLKCSVYSIHTGCPTILWSLRFVQFLGFQRSPDKNFGQFLKALSVLISKLSKIF